MHAQTLMKWAFQGIFAFPHVAQVCGIELWIKKIA